MTKYWGEQGLCSATYPQENRTQLDNTSRDIKSKELTRYLRKPGKSYHGGCKWSKPELKCSELCLWNGGCEHDYCRKLHIFIWSVNHIYANYVSMSMSVTFLFKVNTMKSFPCFIDFFKINHSPFLTHISKISGKSGL